MSPNIQLNFVGIAIACVATFVFGFLWYGPLFGRAWAKGVGLDPDQKPEGMGQSLALQVVGIVLTVWVLAHAGQVWRPSVWGVGEDAADSVYGFFSGFFTWLGYYLPLQLGRVAWEKRPWKVFGINAAHDFLNLQLIAQILAHWE